MANTFVNKAQTPKDFQNNHKLEVPIYQRLFVWEHRQIEKLLDDLLRATKDNTNKPYFIGIITVNEKENNLWEVVDGQQRLTFLTLFGAMCINKGLNADLWERFVYLNSENENAPLRINYFGREDDREDINRIISKEFSQVKNTNFQIFIECFNRLKLQQNEWNAYSKYVFENTSFFVSLLPVNYKPRQLNLFFEKMNSAGRQLEPIDLVKIKFANYASEWNACINFDKAYTKPEQPTTSNDGSSEPSLYEILGNPSKIEITQEKTYENHIGNQLILKPEVFLLHVLSITRNNTNISLDDSKLLETFSKEMKEPTDEEKQDFIKTMKAYRIWLDQNIIYLQADENRSCPYAFRNTSEDNENVAMRQFQSMLYVSSTDSQQWILDAYNECKNNSNKMVTLDILRKRDNYRKTLPDISSMIYPSIDRYWFWKLDYLLWEKIVNSSSETISFSNTSIKFTKDELAAIKNYVFRTNRSIEHLHPRNPPEGQTWDYSILHSLGNLCMISSSFNSSQSNDSIGVKFARVRDTQIPQKTLQSIKMLIMFKMCEGIEANWKHDLAQTHQKDMYGLLEGK